MKHYVVMTGLLAGSLVGMQAHSADREGAAKTRGLTAHSKPYMR
jgi:hypothetical protein